MCCTDLVKPALPCCSRPPAELWNPVRKPPWVPGTTPLLTPWLGISFDSPDCADLAPTPRALLLYTLLGPVSFQGGLFRQQNSSPPSSGLHLEPEDRRNAF